MNNVCLMVEVAEDAVEGSWEEATNGETPSFT
jgi:hypothetical protein